MSKENTLSENKIKNNTNSSVVSELLKSHPKSEDDIRQKLHFEQTPLGVIEFDTNFKIIKWNPSAERIFGYVKDEAIGKRADELIIPDSAKGIVDIVWNELINSKGGTRSTNENVRKDGKIILCDWFNTPLVNDTGKVIGVASLVADITAQEKSKKLQDALYKISEAVHSFVDIQELYKEIHRIIKGLMKADNFYISLYDETTDLISFPYFVDEYDSQPDPEPLGRGLTDYVLKTGKNLLINAEQDLQLRKKGLTDLIGPPSEIWLGVALKVDNKPIGVIVVQDYKDESTYGEEEKQILTYVSEQIASAIKKKIDEQNLKKYSEELKELNASKDKFFSIIAHDLRSPFHGLIGMINIVNDEFDNLSTEELKAYLNEIQNSTITVNTLIENLLDWSRMQTGKMKFEPIRLDLTELINSIVYLLNYSAKLKNITIKNLIDEPIYINADEQMMRSLLQNLISNAIKFTYNDGIIEIFHKIADEDCVEISIKDNGEGISEENIPKLFRIDESYSTPGTNRERGTGLGLLLCHEIIEKHCGKIKVESEKDKGSCFTFTLKLA